MDAKIIHILKLINDPDNNIATIAKNELKKIDNIEQKLKDILNTHKKIEYIDKHEIYQLLTEVVYEKAYDFFIKWKKNSEHSLIEPLYWLAKINYPSLQYNNLQETINNLVRIWEIDTDNLTTIEKLQIINNILYKNLKLQTVNGLRKIDDFMINKVLETGYASMSMTVAIYLIIANLKNLNLTVFKGTENFVVAYVKYATQNQQPIIHFFINPYYKGMISSYDNFIRILKQENLNHKTFFKIISNLDIVKRILSDIKTIYQETDDLKYKYYEQLFRLLY